MKQSKVCALLGFAARAGNIAGGQTAVELAVKRNQAVLLVLAEDASENTRKKIINMAAHRRIPLISSGTRETLGRAVGKSERSCIAVLDRHIADGIRKAVGGPEEERSVL